MITANRELDTEFSNIQILSDEDILESKDLNTLEVTSTEDTISPLSSEISQSESDKETYKNTSTDHYNFTENKEKVGSVVASLLNKKKTESDRVREQATIEVKDKELNADLEKRIPKKLKEVREVLSDETKDIRGMGAITSPSVVLGQSILASLTSFPDFMANTYTAILAPKHFQKSPGELDVGEINKSGDFKDTEIKAAKILRDSFSVRLEGIEIPQPKKDSFETKFLNTSIKRVKPETTIVRSATLNIRQDTDFYLCEFLENASGINKWRKLADKSAVNIFPSLFSTNLSTLDKDKSATSKSFFDLYIFHQVASDRARPITIDNNYILYILRDIRFVGRTSPLDFKSDSADAMTASFKFTFRRCEQIDCRG